MSGAPITFTLYKNGIHLTYGDPDFVRDAAIEAQMRAAFDAGTDAVPYDSPLGDLIRVAIDCMWAVDKRGEKYAGTPVPLKQALAMHKKG